MILRAQVMRKADLIRKNMVQSVKNECNILAMANNPFVVRTPIPPSVIPRARMEAFRTESVGCRA